MRRMVFFELKKIFGRKIVWAGILLVLFLSVAGFNSMGLSNMPYEKEIAAKYEGTLDDAKVQQMLQDFMPSKEQLEQWKGIPVAHIGMNSIQQAVHLRFANDDGTWNGKTVKDVYGDQEIRVGYCEGWLAFSRNLMKITVAISVLCVVMAASVFAGEYSGMDQILLTARCGKTTCAAAKLLAAFGASVMVSGLFLAANLASAGILLGTDGLRSSASFCGAFYENYMPISISCGTMLLYQIGLAMSGILMTTGITVVVSAASGTQLVALIISAFLLLCPVMVPIPESNPAFQILGLLPIWQIQMSSLMSVGKTFGGLFYAVAAFPVSIAAACIGAWLARTLWNRHQVVR